MVNKQHLLLSLSLSLSLSSSLAWTADAILFVRLVSIFCSPASGRASRSLIRTNLDCEHANRVRFVSRQIKLARKFIVFYLFGSYANNQAKDREREREREGRMTVADLTFCSNCHGDHVNN
jgi:cytochrome c553